MAWGRGEVLLATRVFTPWLENRAARNTLLGALRSSLLTDTELSGFDWWLELHELKAWAMDCVHGRPSLPYPWSAADPATRDAIFQLRLHTLSLSITPFLEGESIEALMQDVRDVQKFLNIRAITLTIDETLDQQILRDFAGHASPELDCLVRLTANESTPALNAAYLARCIESLPTKVRCVVETGAFIEPSGKLDERMLQQFFERHRERIATLDVAAPLSQRGRRTHAASTLLTGSQSDLIPALARAVPSEVARSIVGEVPLNHLNLLRIEIAAVAMPTDGVTIAAAM